MAEPRRTAPRLSVESFDDGFHRGFARGEIYALKQAVTHLRGSNEADAADIIEKIIAEKEGALEP